MHVVTDKTEHTPDPSSWSLFKTSSITARLLVARTASNNLAPGGGSYTSSSVVTFTIEKP